MGEDFGGRPLTLCNIMINLEDLAPHAILQYLSANLPPPGPPAPHRNIPVTGVSNGIAGRMGSDYPLRPGSYQWTYSTALSLVWWPEQLILSENEWVSIFFNVTQCWPIRELGLLSSAQNRYTKWEIRWWYWRKMPAIGQLWPSLDKTWHCNFRPNFSN